MFREKNKYLLIERSLYNVFKEETYYRGYIYNKYLKKVCRKFI